MTSSQFFKESHLEESIDDVLFKTPFEIAIDQRDVDQIKVLLSGKHEPINFIDELYVVSKAQDFDKKSLEIIKLFLVYLPDIQILELVNAIEIILQKRMTDLQLKYDVVNFLINHRKDSKIRTLEWVSNASKLLFTALQFFPEALKPLHDSGLDSETVFAADKAALRTFARKIKERFGGQNAKPCPLNSSVIVYRGFFSPIIENYQGVNLTPTSDQNGPQNSCGR